MDFVCAYQARISSTPPSCRRRHSVLRRSLSGHAERNVGSNFVILRCSRRLLSSSARYSTFPCAGLMVPSVNRSVVQAMQRSYAMIAADVAALVGGFVFGSLFWRAQGGVFGLFLGR